MARKLTTPIRVNNINLTHIQSLIDQDKINYIIRESDTGEKIRYNMKYATYSQGTKILCGDIVVRNGQELENVQTLLPGDKLIRDGIELENLQFFVKKAFNVQIGDIAERQIETGQIIVLNRQPTQPVQ